MSDLKELIIQLSRSRNEPEWLRALRLKNLKIYEEFEEVKIADSPIEKQYSTSGQLIEYVLRNIEPLYSVGSFEEQGNRFCIDYSKSNREKINVELGKVSIMSMNEAVTLYPNLIRESMSKASNTYSALINATWNSGLFVHVLRDRILEKPLRFYTTYGSSPLIEKNVFVIGDNSNVSIINNSSLYEHGKGLVDLTFLVGNNSVLKNITVQNGNDGTFLTHHYSYLGANSVENWFYALKNFKYHYMSSHTDLNGEYSNTKVKGAIMGKDEQVYESDIDSTHTGKYSISDLNARAALLDQSRAIMRGNIKILKQATGSDAYYAGNALLLSNKASSIALPFLEIEGDGAKARHAATSSSVDPEQIFYIMTRGISETKAKSILIEGFLEPVVKELLISEGMRYLILED